MPKQKRSPSLGDDLNRNTVRLALLYYAAAVSLMLFFFSSRRPHTSLQGDWSSDVCSSDLFAVRVVKLCHHLNETPGVGRTLSVQLLKRSEERRVGRECRSRCDRGHETK